MPTKRKREPPLTRKLLTAVGVLIVLVVIVGVVGEFAGPRLVESRTEERVRANTDGEVTVEADVQSSPFLPVLLAQGRINRMTVTLKELSGYGIPVTVRFVLDGVSLDRQALLTGRAELRRVDGGGAAAELSQRGISQGMNINVDINRDGIVLGPMTAVLDADLRTQGRTVAISHDSFQTVEVSLPQSLLPCPDPEVELDDDTAIGLSCELEDVPPVLTSE